MKALLVKAPETQMASTSRLGALPLLSEDIPEIVVPPFTELLLDIYEWTQNDELSYSVHMWGVFNAAGSIIELAEGELAVRRSRPVAISAVRSRSNRWYRGEYCRPPENVFVHMANGDKVRVYKDGDEESDSFRWPGTTVTYITQLLRLFHWDNTVAEICQLRGDLFASLRGKSRLWMISFSRWLANNHGTEIIKSSMRLETYLLEFGLYSEVEMRAQEFGRLMVSGWEGQGEVVQIVEIHRFFQDDEFRTRISAVLNDGTYVHQGKTGELGIVYKSPFWHALRLINQIEPRLRKELVRRHGPHAALCELQEKDPSWIERAAEYIGNETIGSYSAYKRLLDGLDNITESPICVTFGFETNWVSNFYDKFVWNQAHVLRSQFQARSGSFDVDGIEIEKFARENLPQNSLVESVTSLKNGQVRVILREPIQPYLIQRRGRTYVEEVPGTIADMTVAAFDLNFKADRSGFPHAKAYRNRECTEVAQHTNISQSLGSVCLGDINREMSDLEVEMRGGIAMPSLGDFIQMLRQCNLDSAYNSSKSFVLRHPDSVTDAQWAEPVWNIPGLRVFDTDSFIDLT